MLIYIIGFIATLYVKGHLLDEDEEFLFLIALAWPITVPLRLLAKTPALCCFLR